PSRSAHCFKFTYALYRILKLRQLTTLTGDLSFHDRALLLLVLGGVLLVFSTAIVAGTWLIAGRYHPDPADRTSDPDRRSRT
ncbi:hypothetical protein MXD60_16820, partial [Frankia sp. AgB32]|nr:hypothetical protein [Frankia sp. AgB32]